MQKTIQLPTEIVIKIIEYIDFYKRRELYKLFKVEIPITFFKQCFDEVVYEISRRKKTSKKRYESDSEYEYESESESDDSNWDSELTKEDEELVEMFCELQIKKN